MKKFAKMSLVAALAVAGTAASAQPLAEAIKNVDVSGTVVYRYDDRDRDDHAKDSSANNYKIGLTAKAKVNDDVTAVTRFIIGGADNGFAGLDTTNQGDQNVDVSLSNVYFSYTGIANTTVNVGKQGLTTPWTVAVDSDGNEQTGTGILALTNVGPVTLAGAYFNQTNLGTTPAQNSASGDITLGDGSDNVITAGVMANVGPVALDAWYLDMQDQFDTFTIGASANFDLDAVKLSVGARHTALDLDDSNSAGLDDNLDQELTKIMLGLKAGIFTANVNYGWTDDEGGIAALDNDAKTGMQGWTVQLNGVRDAEYLQVKAGAQVLPSLNLSVNYHQLDMNKNTDMGRASDLTNKELYLQASYQMSKNFGGYVRFGEAELEDAAIDGDDLDRTIGRLQVQYSF